MTLRHKLITGILVFGRSISHYVFLILLSRLVSNFIVVNGTLVLMVHAMFCTWLSWIHYLLWIFCGRRVMCSEESAPRRPSHTHIGWFVFLGTLNAIWDASVYTLVTSNNISSGTCIIWFILNNIIVNVLCRYILDLESRPAKFGFVGMAVWSIACILAMIGSTYDFENPLGIVFIWIGSTANIIRGFVVHKLYREHESIHSQMITSNAKTYQKIIDRGHLLTWSSLIRILALALLGWRDLINSDFQAMGNAIVETLKCALDCHWLLYIGFSSGCALAVYMWISTTLDEKSPSYAGISDFMVYMFMTLLFSTIPDYVISSPWNIEIWASSSALGLCICACFAVYLWETAIYNRYLRRVTMSSASDEE